MNKNNLLELEQESIGKLLWKYSIPAVIGTLVIATYNIIDRIFIGQGVGAEAIAGLAVTFPLMNISAALGMLIGVGAAARISIALGEKSNRLAETILGNSLVMILLIGIAYTMLFLCNLEDILRLFGASDATLPYAYEYTLYYSPGFLIANLTYSFNNAMGASGYPKKAMVTMIIGAVLNTILDPIFIFWLDMGVKGAAIATDISMFVSMCFVFIHLMNKKSNLYFSRGTFKLHRNLIFAIISIGTAPFVINIAGSFINAFLNNILVTQGGDNAVGAAGIFTTYTQLLIMAVMGVSQGMQPILGYNYGAKRIHRLKATFKLGVIVSTLICAVGALIAIFIPQIVAYMFTTDAGLIHETCTALRISMLMFWMAGFHIVATTLFQSIGLAKESILLSFARQAIFIIPLLLIFPHYWGLTGAWVAFPVSDIFVSAVALYLVIREYKYLNTVTTAKN